MKLPAFISSQAQEDLADVFDFFTQYSESSARKKVNLLVEKCLDLADMPYMGRARPDLGKNLPSLVFQNYLIIYTLEPDAVYVKRVLHGRRDIKRILEDD